MLGLLLEDLVVTDAFAGVRILFRDSVRVFFFRDDGERAVDLLLLLFELLVDRVLLL